MNETGVSANRPVVSALASLFHRLMNIFVCPAEVFDELARSKFTHTNWFVPVLLSCLVTTISFLVLGGEQGDAQRPIVEDQRIPALLHIQGTAGNRTAADNESVLAVVRLNGVLTVAAGTLAGTLWSALVIWGIGRLLLKRAFHYGKALEVAGLTQIILMLASIITALLVVATGDASVKPGLSLLVQDFDSHNKIHLALANLNLFNIWAVAVLTRGLAGLSGVSFGEAAFWTFGYWFGVRLALIFLSRG